MYLHASDRLLTIAEMSLPAATPRHCVPADGWQKCHSPPCEGPAVHGGGSDPQHREQGAHKASGRTPFRRQACRKIFNDRTTRPPKDSFNHHCRRTYIHSHDSTSGDAACAPVLGCAPRMKAFRYNFGAQPGCKQTQRKQISLRSGKTNPAQDMVFCAMGPGEASWASSRTRRCGADT